MTDNEWWKKLAVPPKDLGTSICGIEYVRARLRYMRQLAADEEEADRLVGKLPYRLFPDDEPPQGSPGKERKRAA